MNDTSWVNCKSNQLKPIVKKRKSNQCSKQKIDDHKQNNIATQKFNTEQKKKSTFSVSTSERQAQKTSNNQSTEIKSIWNYHTSQKATRMAFQSHMISI